MSWLQDITSRLAAAAADPEPLADGGRRWHPMSIADGYVGLALVFAGSDNPADRATAHRLLLRGVRSAHPAHESVFDGLPAVALAGRMLARTPGDYAKLLSSADNATIRIAERLLATEEERLASGRSGVRMQHYDVSFGLAGLGRVLLADVEQHRAVLERTLRYLVRLIEPVTPGRRPVPGWWTPDPAVLNDPVAAARGHLNPGLAHGIAGPLALLALAATAGVEVTGQRAAVARIAEWLLARRGYDEYGPYWPAVVPLEYEERGSVRGLPPSRVAWCYGAPGIARALQLAARAYAEPAWERAALTTLTAALARPWSTTGIRDASLCHGSAGVLHVLSLVARDAASPTAIEPLTRRVRAHLNTFVDPESRFDVRTTPAHWAGVLDGAAGVALVLRGTPPAATTLTWDAALLLA
ncbi:lanthionine synthetase C family protein [Micromonospora sp. NPDC049102]|uniref:lanthionine synthetase C family protein n=1 Tax=Micromonospora sp. NPDC049102 TaxID=3364265 RepID=UPI00370FE07C